MFLKRIMLCFLVNIFIPRCVGFFTVVGSRTALFNGTYELYVTRSVEIESDEKLSFELKGLESGEKRFKQVELRSNDNEHEKLVIFDLNSFNKVEDFLLTVELEGTEVIHNVTIFTVAEKYMTLIQTDKPNYKPGDEVKYRVIVLDAETKPYKAEQFEVTIFDSNGKCLSEYSNSLLEDQVDWVYQGLYVLSDSLPLGTFYINVTVDNTYVTIRSFEVTEQVQPRFQAHIECKSNILLSNSVLEMEVFGEYTFGEYVSGNVTVAVEVLHHKNLHSVIKTMTQQGKVLKKRKFEFSFKDDLSVRTSSRVRVNVTIEEESTGKTASDSKIVYISERDDHQIELISDERYFTPGFTFTVSAIVRRFDGELETNGGEKVKFSRTEKSNGRTSKIMQEIDLKNSEAELTFKVPKFLTSIDISVSYNGGKTSKVFSRKQEAFFLKAKFISPNLNNQVGDSITILVESTHRRESIYALISGHHRKVSSYEGNMEKFVFDVELTLEMAPTVNIIVYYIHDYGGIIYDRVTVNIDSSVARQLEVNLPFNVSSPGQLLNVEMKTMPHAVIGLSVVDLSVLLGKKSNGIDEMSVIDAKLKFKPSLTYEELKINGVKSIFEDFGYSNAFLLTDGNGDFKKVESRIDNDDYDYNDIFKNDKSEKVPEKVIRKNFPETWLFECYQADKNGIATISITTPDTITSWMFSGFSIDPQHGLSLLKPKRLNVKLKFFIKINLPYSIRRGEILKVDVLVFNYLDRTKNTRVKVELFGDPTFEIIEKTSNCNFKATVNKNDSRTISSAFRSVTNASFHIRPLEEGKLKLRIKATCQDIDDSDEIEKELLVEHDGITFYKNYPIWIDLTKAKQNQTRLPIIPSKNAIPKSIKLGGSLIGDFLGPAVLDVSKLIRLPTGCGEQRLVTFVPTVLATKYLISIKKLTGDHKRLSNKILRTGYSQILERKNADGSFNLWGYGKSESIWLTAYVIKCLKHSQGLLTVNPKHINDGLNFLQSKQNSSTGSFGPEHGPINHRRVQGGATSEVPLTAYILISFLENPLNQDKYKSTIDKGLEFIHSRVIGLKSNYVCAISAYALVLAKHPTAGEILAELNSTAHISEDQMYWTKSGRENGEESSIAHEVELASYALLAFLKFGDTLTAILIMNWLVTKRNAQGGFYSSQDTVIGIQALAEMANMFYYPDVNMKVTVAYENASKVFDVNPANRLKLQNIDIPPSARNFRISAEGTGKALVNIWYSFSSLKERKAQTFNLSLNVKKSRKKNVFYLETCVNFIARRDKNSSGMSLIEINLPSGYIYDSDSTPFLKPFNVKRVETRDGKSIVILYFDRITTQKICPEIKSIQIQEVEQLKSSSVKVYEYSNPDIHVVDFYTPSAAQSCI